MENDYEEKEREREYNFSFIEELDENNTWLLDRIREEDGTTFLLLQKAKEDVFILSLAGLKQVASELVEKYRELLIQAYPYYIARHFHR